MKRARRRGLLAATGKGAIATGLAWLLSMPGSSPAAPIDPPTTPRTFPVGVFQDGNLLGGSAAAFQAMLEDLRRHHLDSVFFTNNVVTRDAPLLDVSDQLGVDVYFAPVGELSHTWWPSRVAPSLDSARRAIAPIVDRVKTHRSLKGYAAVDEPSLADLRKVALMTRMLHDLDPARPVIPTLVGIDRVGPIFLAARPDVMLIDVYPVARDNPIGDFSMKGFGYPELDFVSYIRAVTLAKPADVPLWVILQTHGLDAGRFGLREPIPAEVRAQHWLAIGEGATGIFWFIYGTEQGWTGLKDNPTLFDVVAELAARVRPIRDTLVQLRPAAQRFTVNGGSVGYVSTLVRPDGESTFAVVVNRDCARRQSLAIDAPGLAGALRDLESGRSYPLRAPLSLAAGDGRVFELIRSDR